MNEIQTALNENRLSHDDNHWLRWCCRNVTVDVSKDGAICTKRGKRFDHYDAFQALIMAMIQAMPAASKPSKSIYNTRGLIVL
jgi:phage terminase large subunit-like protein